MDRRFLRRGSGDYGPLTFKAIQAFQKRAGARRTVISSPGSERRWRLAADKARGEVRFTKVQDGKAGIASACPKRC